MLLKISKINLFLACLMIFIVKAEGQQKQQQQGKKVEEKPPRDYYEVMGLKKNAKEAEIKKV